MTDTPDHVLTYNLEADSNAVDLMDMSFRSPANRSFKNPAGEIAWDHFSAAGRKAFGEQPYFYSQEQFEAATQFPDKKLADRCDQLRSDPRGNIVPIGRDDAGIEWGTNFTHFTYKDLTGQLAMTSLAKSMLGFNKCNRQTHFFYYPKGSYREWHTNEGSPHPGWRVYFVKAMEPGKSFFSYVQDDQMKIVPDQRYCIRICRFGGGLEVYHSVCAKETGR